MNIRIVWVRAMRWNACVHRLGLGLYSHPKEFGGNGVRTYVNSKGKIPSTWKILLRGGSNPWHCIKWGQEAQRTTNKLLRPPLASLKAQWQLIIFKCNDKWLTVWKFIKDGPVLRRWSVGWIIFAMQDRRLACQPYNTTAYIDQYATRVDKTLYQWW